MKKDPVGEPREESKTRRLLLAHRSLLSIQWYHWLPAAEDGVRAGANSAEDEMRAGARFTVSPFDWSCLSSCLGAFCLCLFGACCCCCCGVFCLLVLVLTRPFRS